MLSDSVNLVFTLVPSSSVQPVVAVQSLLERSLDVVYHHGHIALGGGDTSLYSIFMHTNIYVAIGIYGLLKRLKSNTNFTVYVECAL